MNEEMFKKLMELFGHLIDNDDSEIVDFAELTDEDLEHVVTVHPDKDGNLVFSLFEPEQWMMIEGIAEMTRKAG
jgi:hypothetical protein